MGKHSLHQNRFHLSARRKTMKVLVRAEREGLPAPGQPVKFSPALAADGKLVVQRTRSGDFYATDARGCFRKVPPTVALKAIARQKQDEERAAKSPLALGLSLVLLVFALGCASTVKRVAGAQNVHDFRKARYDEACHVPQFPDWCKGYDEKLNAFKKHLGEARIALQWGGPLPLQLQQLKADEKGLKR